MPTAAVESWRDAFFATVQSHDHALALKDASLRGRLGEWTEALTTVSVATCQSLGWHASAKGYCLDLLPVPRHEYLSLDVMAFADGEKRWRFPAAVLELENSKDDDRIAYSLWKVMCVRADLRLVFCYRKSADAGASLIRSLRDEVVQAMGIEGRLNLQGETVVVVGSRDDAETFPYRFFKWWRLDVNTGSFRLL